jgi:hypothetical protein
MVVGRIVKRKTKTTRKLAAHSAVPLIVKGGSARGVLLEVVELQSAGGRATHTGGW